VLAEHKQPALRDGVSAHALRKTYFTFLHETGAHGSPTRADTRTPSTSLRIYTESLRDRHRDRMAKRSIRCSRAIGSAARYQAPTQGG